MPYTLTDRSYWRPELPAQLQRQMTLAAPHHRRKTLTSNNQSNQSLCDHLGSQVAHPGIPGGGGGGHFYFTLFSYTLG